MNKKNLILLIVMGINLVVGLVLFILDESEPKSKYVPIAILLATFIGALLCLWNIVGKLMGRSMTSLAVYVIVVFISICLMGASINSKKDGSKTGLIISIIYLILDVIYAIKCFIGLRIVIDPPQDTTE